MGANAPELQEDFGWRSNHVVTIITKAITTQFYGVPIKHSYMVGNSKGGQAVLLEAQRFPEDFDGLMPSAPVYDYTGRNVLAGTWFAQAISDGNGGSVLNAEAAQAVHKSVLEHCGAQADVEEGLVTNPPSCKWHLEMIACALESSGTDCLNAKQVAAVKRLMTAVTNSTSSFDLRAFKARGGKILLWHGWADGAIMATSSIGYYEGVIKVMGGRRQTEDFFRLFLVPGVHHGGGGPGFTEFDSMTALENWLEKGEVPEKLIASRSANGTVERSRPFFPYPVLARYSGNGDPRQADSFVPFDPSQH